MRILNSDELTKVSGGGSETAWAPDWGLEDTTSSKKNNNGYGNGPESGPPPGNSIKNPQLLTWNSGKRGAR